MKGHYIEGVSPCLSVINAVNQRGLDLLRRGRQVIPRMLNIVQEKRDGFARITILVINLLVPFIH